MVTAPKVRTHHLCPSLISQGTHQSLGTTHDFRDTGHDSNETNLLNLYRFVQFILSSVCESDGRPLGLRGRIGKGPDVGVRPFFMMIGGRIDGYQPLR